MSDPKQTEEQSPSAQDFDLSDIGMTQTNVGLGQEVEGTLPGREVFFGAELRYAALGQEGALEADTNNLLQVVTGVEATPGVTADGAPLTTRDGLRFGKFHIDVISSAAQEHQAQTVALQN